MPKKIFTSGLWHLSVQRTFSSTQNSSWWFRVMTSVHELQSRSRNRFTLGWGFPKAPLCTRWCIWESGSWSVVVLCGCRQEAGNPGADAELLLSFSCASSLSRSPSCASWLTFWLEKFWSAPLSFRRRNNPKTFPLERLEKRMKMRSRWSRERQKVQVRNISAWWSRFARRSPACRFSSSTALKS